MRAIFLHILADTLGSVAVLVSTLAVQMLHWHWADPVASVSPTQTKSTWVRVVGWLYMERPCPPANPQHYKSMSHTGLRLARQQLETAGTCLVIQLRGEHETIGQQRQAVH